ncbi:hypothetical protein [Xanthocytophaga agilis]|uniref:Uncharacterized protein n=1 Tax=Xanthocytophaga agilis TaxID=3048010 RepID=A0AAE3R917_9BACT|nr:hypothetical protein [Xanthocytophaga agilis]MDJ1503694.1 hypothetical protein [Xanthocytophaga agilis]
MRYILLFCLLLQIACHSNPVSNDRFFDEIDLGSSGSEKRLLIETYFDECGEWGGHREMMTIYAKRDMNFYLDYEKYRITCGSAYNDQKVEYKKTLKLDASNKKSITEYIQYMVNAKIVEHYPGHAGYTFNILKSDSTLLINVYSQDLSNIESYQQLQKGLNLPITIVREEE